MGQVPHPLWAACADHGVMRASIRRIDLTQQPARVDVWPSVDWLAVPDEAPEPRRIQGPRGRGGLWAAMASAVARAREASTADTDPAELGGLGTLDEPHASAEVIDLAVEAPHLAYLARVAAGTDDGYEADVIVFDPPRFDAEG